MIYYLAYTGLKWYAYAYVSSFLLDVGTELIRKEVVKTATEYGYHSVSNQYRNYLKK